jgi:hypothetical protein
VGTEANLGVGGPAVEVKEFLAVRCAEADTGHGSRPSPGIGAGGTNYRTPAADGWDTMPPYFANPATRTSVSWSRYTTRTRGSRTLTGNG